MKLAAGQRRVLPLWVWIPLCLLACGSAAAQLRQIPLDHGWRFRAAAAIADHPEATVWRAATVPGVVQTDLRNAGVIPDPFFGVNEKQLQWIGQSDWEYSQELQVTPALLRSQHIEIVFEGLDTFAEVSVNGTHVLTADNMFRSWRAELKPVLRLGKNTIRILFHSPANELWPTIAKLPYVLPGSGYETLDRASGIYPLSQYARKAGYSFGWDWGPRLITQGIWRPVRLEVWDTVRITAFHVHQLAVNRESALTEGVVDVVSDRALPTTLRFQAASPEGKHLEPQTMQVELKKGENHFALQLTVDHPRLWFPNGYGSQDQYMFSAELLRAARPVARVDRKVGLRSLELRQVEDPWGTSFTFVVNGIPVFAKGANFIPPDSFPPSTSSAKLRGLLLSARDTHMNMLRVWGGGFYETDEFYDLCDQFGLLVWQDFMFGGGMVPGDPAFQDNVRSEATEQVQRLSDHASLALWCGNNEVETAWDHWGAFLGFRRSVSKEVSQQVWQEYLDLFHGELHDVVAEYGNGVAYWPSSPSAGDAELKKGMAAGDMHSWSVWSAGAPISSYAKDSLRFLSEFGFQAMPDVRTVRAFAGFEEDLKSPVFEDHERFVNGYQRMDQYLSEEFRKPRDFASRVYLSQVMQAQAIRYAVEHMRSREPEVMGTLFWQLDDCWPAVSWSSIDYFGRWKALQFDAARFYAPLLITAEPGDGLLDVHIVSDEMQERAASLHLRILRFDGSVIQDEMRPVTVSALASTPAGSFALKKFDKQGAFAVLTLESGKETLAANTVYFAKARDLKLQEPSISTQIRRDKTRFIVELRSASLARSVDLDFGDLDALPGDNFFDLLPGEAREIPIESKASLAQLQAALHVRSVADAMEAK